MYSRISNLESRLIQERKERFELQFELNNTIDQMQTVARDLLLQKSGENWQQLWLEADADRNKLVKQLVETKATSLSETIKLRKKLNFLSGNFTEDTDITEICNCETALITTLGKIQALKQEKLTRLTNTNKGI